ncbi:MAG: hypothetical protein ACRBF0_18775 [Calditrichia bacterium]
MSTEFTKLNNSIITPIMKAKGFRKIGKYHYGATFDKAFYKSPEKECQIIYSVHPSDYPILGIRFEEISNGKVVFKKQYLLEGRDLGGLVKTLAGDLEAGNITI